MDVVYSEFIAFYLKAKDSLDKSRLVFLNPSGQWSNISIAQFWQDKDIFTDVLYYDEQTLLLSQKVLLY